MNVRLLSIFLAVLVVCFAAGCVKVRSHLEINKTGGAQVNHTVAFDMSEMPTMTEPVDPLEKVRKNFEQDGYTVKDYARDKLKGFTASRKFSRIADALVALSDTKKLGAPGTAPSGGARALADIGEKIKVERSLFTTRYRLDLTLDSTPPVATSSDPYNTFNEAREFVGTMLDVSFALTLPVKPTSHNAPRVSDGGRTLEWPLVVDQKTSLQFDAEVPNTVNILIAIIGGFAVLVGVGVAIRNKMAA